MKRYLAAIIMLVVFLALFIPLASKNPDGMEKVASSLGVRQPEPVWSGLMNDYMVNAVGNSYGSALATGVLGTLFVLGAALILGEAITRRDETVKEKVAGPSKNS